MATGTIRAVFENGVFRPLEKIELPEHSQFEFEPRPLIAEAAAETDDMAEIYEILSRRYSSGHVDTAARHDEHQP